LRSCASPGARDRLIAIAMADVLVADSPRNIGPAMTPREKLHRLVDELSDAEAEAALAQLVRQRELLGQWARAGNTDATEDAWALANAREAIREERW
jgi:hypothetical protein